MEGVCNMKFPMPVSPTNLKGDPGSSVSNRTGGLAGNGA